MSGHNSGGEGGGGDSLPCRYLELVLERGEKKRMGMQGDSIVEDFFVFRVLFVMWSRLEWACRAVRERDMFITSVCDNMEQVLGKPHILNTIDLKSEEVFICFLIAIPTVKLCGMWEQESERLEDGAKS